LRVDAYTVDDIRFSFFFLIFLFHFARVLLKFLFSGSHFFQAVLLVCRLAIAMDGIYTGFSRCLMMLCFCLGLVMVMVMLSSHVLERYLFTFPYGHL